MKERYNASRVRGKRQRTRSIGEGIEGSGRLAPSRAQEHAEERAIEALLGAFVDGKLGRSLRHADPVRRAAWLRGRTFAILEASGARPLDSVRVKP
jgi:hypothetical protein